RDPRPAPRAVPRRPFWKTVRCPLTGGFRSGRPAQDHAMSRTTSDARPPEPGDLYVLAETADFPVEWAVLDARAGHPQRRTAAPTPPAGSADGEGPATAAAGPLSLRCRFALRLDAARFDPARRTGALAPAAVARALEKRAALEAGDPAASPLAWEVDADPE